MSCRRKTRPTIPVAAAHVNQKFCALVLLGVMAMGGCAAPHAQMAVNVAVSDLRAQPRPRAVADAHDPLQETQLLYGERVRVLKAVNGWASVEAIEQPEWTHAKRWQGYPGWLPLASLSVWDALRAPTIVVTRKWARAWRDPYQMTPLPWRLPFGTYVRATDMGGQLWRVELLDATMAWMAYADARALGELNALAPAQRRRLVVSHAQQFLGDPYDWGGRSPTAPPASAVPSAPVTGVDCSGLTSLVYRAIGVEIPRDAHEQFLRARRIAAPRIGDLLFLSEPNHPSRMVHVMLYAGTGDVIEAPGTGFTVRRIALEQRLGRSVEQLASGEVVKEQSVFFGTFLD